MSDFFGAAAISRSLSGEELDQFAAEDTGATVSHYKRSRCRIRVQWS